MACMCTRSKMSNGVATYNSGGRVSFAAGWGLHAVKEDSEGEGSCWAGHRNARCCCCSWVSCCFECHCLHALFYVSATAPLKWILFLSNFSISVLLSCLPLITNCYFYFQNTCLRHQSGLKLNHFSCHRKECATLEKRWTTLPSELH